ncbi:MAG: ATP-binding protein [Candidatus Eremiobacteraeota bacterium]|nr:ATP-binding protein [Candidatus Eremiobacteraeota bacterium]MBV8434514.1 ATP-binding protein [Candidatus Eremiobacteraeota bacterium]
MNAPEFELQTLGAVELRIPARAEWVAVARLAAAAVASRMRFSVDEIDDIKLAIAEACTSCIQRSEGVENIDIRWDALPAELRITVVGDGRGPKLESVKNGSDDKVGGLGVFLIRALMDTVEYEVDPERGPRLVMSKSVQP